MRVTLFTDGGVRTGGKNGATAGHDGRSAIGYVIKQDGKVIEKGNYDLGIATVNEAEYSGLLYGLYVCRSMGATHVESKMDSQLVVNQVNGAWKCKSERIQEYLDEVWNLAESFEEVTFEWVPRTLNQHADQMVREVLDGRNA